MSYSEHRAAAPEVSIIIPVYNEEAGLAEFYRLTAAGRKKLQTETANWNRMAEVMASILGRKAEEI